VPGSWPLFALEGEGSRETPAAAPDDHLGPIDKARVRLARSSPRASRAISRLIMKGADESLTPK
jgi:hypothetical protein